MHDGNLGACISNRCIFLYVIFISLHYYIWASQVTLVVKSSPVSAGDVRDKGSIPGSGRSPGGGHGNPLQYSCLENPMDRGAWCATVHRVAKSQTRLNQPSTHSRTITYHVYTIKKIKIDEIKHYDFLDAKTLLQVYLHWKFWTPLVYSHALYFLLLLPSVLFHGLPSTTKWVKAKLLSSPKAIIPMIRLLSVFKFSGLKFQQTYNTYLQWLRISLPTPSASGTSEIVLWSLVISCNKLHCMLSS